MTKRQIHFELDSLIELVNDRSVIANTADIPMAIADLRVFMQYLLFDRNALRYECECLRKNK